MSTDEQSNTAGEDFDAFASAPAAKPEGPLFSSSAEETSKPKPTSQPARPASQPSPTRPTTNGRPTAQRRTINPRNEDDHAFHVSLQPDDNSVVAKRLSERFRTALLVLLCLYLVVYLLESTIGEFSPTGPDMILLFLGWYAQDNYRLRALKLYVSLSTVSIIIDTLGFVSSLVFIVSRSFPAWITIVLIVLFLAESVFKIATIVHARSLQAHLAAVDRLPVESEPLIE